MAEDDARNQHTNWCFTIHYGGPGQLSPTEADAIIERLKSKSKYLIAGRETAPSTSQRHYQGYLQLLRRARLSELKKYSSVIHWEPAKGTAEQNRDYCTKSCGDDFVEHGDSCEVDPGKREQKRWADTRKAATEGRIEDVPDQIYVQHYASLRHIMRDHLKCPADASDVTGLWIYGLTGSGKSRYARATYGTDPSQLFLKPINKWWDGYRQQPYVLLEDFGKDHAVLGYHLKIWADRYAFPVEIKGGTIACRPEKIIVTSQYHPRDIWSDAETLDAIQRRFKLKYIGDVPNPWEAHLVLPDNVVDENISAANLALQSVTKKLKALSPSKLKTEIPRPSTPRPASPLSVCHRQSDSVGSVE